MKLIAVTKLQHSTYGDAASSSYILYLLVIYVITD